MAKVGEGDQRWIVKEREDGKNVGNWHWSETNCLKMAEERLKELLVGVELVRDDAGTVCTLAAVTKCEGDCYTYNRKGRMYLFYDLHMELKWEARTALDDKIEGTIELPNVSDDIESEELELMVKTSGAGGDVLTGAIRGEGRAVLSTILVSFFQGLKDELKPENAPERPAPSPEAPAAAAPAATPAPAPAKPSNKSEPAKSGKGKAKEGGGKGKVVDMKLRFDVSAGALYDALTNPMRVMGYTCAPAVLETTPGGRMELFAGSIRGQYRELVPNKKIVMTWRMASWPEGAESLVTITLTGEERAVLHLRHENIPERDTSGSEVVPQVSHGWNANFFDRMRAAFGWHITRQ